MDTVKDFLTELYAIEEVRYSIDALSVSIHTVPQASELTFLWL